MLQDQAPKEGSILNTCILQWSLDDASFWRDPSMAAVFDIAKSIALTGWKEAGKDKQRETVRQGDFMAKWIARQSLDCGELF